MLMNQPIFGILTACLCMLLAGGCSHTDAVVTKEPAAVTHKADQPATEQPKVLKAAKASTGKVVNTIAAIVNDEIVTLYEVDSEAQSVIREAEKK